MRVRVAVLSFLMALGMVSFAAPASATIQQVTPRILDIRPGVIATGRRTANRMRFDPAVHGFRFSNYFGNNFIPEFDWRTDGLCGGMIFAALDYFNNPHIPLPTQDYRPADGTALRDYIYARQNHSVIDQNLAQWIELSFNPHGQRNSEFYRWGLEGRLDQLRREIDAGRPVPLGLKSCSGWDYCGGDHQVIAIGYDVSGYDGDPRGSTVREVRIIVYDPNQPGQIRTLSPAPESVAWRYHEPNEEGRRLAWQAWFIENYTPQTPPVITQAPRELVLTLGTGGDDLRGTNDNLNAHVLTRSGRTLTFNNINRGHPWLNNSEQEIALPIPDDVRLADVRGVRLETTSRGGLGGDNWNLDYISIAGIERGARSEFFYDENFPLFRFTGDQREREFLFCPGCR